MQQSRTILTNYSSLWISAVTVTCLLMWAMHVKLGLIQQAPSPPGALQQQHRTISLPQTAEKGTDYFPDNGLASLQGAKLVMVGYTNSAYLDWALNFAAYCNRLRLKYMIIASDRNAVATLQLNGILFYDASAAAEAQPYLGTAALLRFRDRADLMRQMGHVKVKTALHLMKQYQWQTMVLTDTDTAWFQDPAVLVQMYPDADVMVSTDCLSAQHSKDLPRCHMVPGGWTSAWNTGVVVVRNTPAALSSLQEWADRLTPDAPNKTPEGWVIEDQLAYSNVLDEGSLPWVNADAGGEVAGQGISKHDSAHVDQSSSDSSSAVSTAASSDSSRRPSGLLWAWNKQLKVMPLPPLVLANGQVAFEQRLPEYYNVTPVGIHNTFQTYHANAGKESRMRENNLWLTDPPDHYTAKFLTYDNMVQHWIDRVSAVWRQHTGREMVLLQKHLLGAAFQIQVLAEALAAARVLKRVLIPPRFECYCWQDVSAYTDMLDTCKMLGTDPTRPLPMNCSASFFVNVADPGYLQHLRYPNFLANPRMQDTVQSSSIRVQVVNRRNTAAEPQWRAVDDKGQAPVLPRYPSDQELVQSLAGHGSKGVVYLGHLAPGWLAGVTNQADFDFVKDLIYNLTAMSGWCCVMTESVGTAVGQDMKHAFVGYQWPQVLTVEAARVQLESAGLFSEVGGVSNDQVGPLWRPMDALFTKPDWCASEAGYLKPYNIQLTNRPQHPCNYLSGFDLSPGFKQQLDGALVEVHQLRVASHAQSVAST